MLLRQIQNVVAVSLKCFFDIDVHSSSNLFVMLVVIPGFMKLFCSRILAEFHEGLLTVKDDAISFAHSVKERKEQWSSSDTHELLTNYTRTIKQHLSGR